MPWVTTMLWRRYHCMRCGISLGMEEKPLFESLLDPPPSLWAWLGDHRTSGNCDQFLALSKAAS